MSGYNQFHTDQGNFSTQSILKHNRVLSPHATRANIEYLEDEGNEADLGLIKSTNK